MGLLSALADWLHPASKISPAALAAIDRIVDLVDSTLHSVSSCHRMLHAPVHHALGYCEGLVASLPPPIMVDRRAFGSDPLVHALFATAGGIDDMLGRSQAIRDYLAEPASLDSPDIYALLATRRRSKHVLGTALQGEVLRSDVPQELLYFCDHTLAEPALTPEAVIKRMRASTLDSLALSFRAHLDALRLERKGLQGERELERAHLTVLRGKTAGPEYEVHTRRIAEVDARLRQTAESLNAEHVIEALANALTTPEVSLRLEPVTIAVDRTGVVSDPANTGDGDVLQFSELISRDRRRNVVLLVKISRQDAQCAVDSMNDQKHRFLII